VQPEYHNAFPLGYPVQLGPARVTLQSAFLGPVRRRVGQTENPGQKPILQLRLSVQNTSTALKFDYEAPRNVRHYARLFDEHGNYYRQYDKEEDVAERTDTATLYPGQWINDVFLFEVPVAAAQFLTFRFPSSAVGQDEEVVFDIPVAAIRR
jgi:hypothetical protein